MRTTWLVALVALALGSPSSATAGERRGDLPTGPAERRRGSADAPDRPEQIKRKVRALRAFTLTEELALDESTAARLFPVLSRYDDDFDKLLERRGEVQRRLRRAESLRDARAIDRLIDEAVANQRGFWELEDRRIQALRKILTPAQTARLLVVLPALERRIGNQLRKVIIKRKPSTVEEDDDEEPEEATAPAKRPRREVPLAPPSSRSYAPGNTVPCDPSAGPCR